MAGKRRWFQIHLSTACILMLVAGMLVWVNVRTIETTGSYLFILPVTSYAQGWPLKIRTQQPEAQFNPYPENSEANITILLHEEWHRKHLAIDILTALALLAATAFGCEFWIRRRERLKQEPTA